MKIRYEVDADEPLDNELLRRYAALPALCHALWEILEQDWPRDVRCRLNGILEKMAWTCMKFIAEIKSTEVTAKHTPVQEDIMQDA